MTTIDTLAGRIRAEAVEMAVRRLAPDLGANADELLDSRSFLAAAARLDEDSPDFARQVRAAAQTAVESDPRFAAAAAETPAVGATPASGDRPAQWTLDDVRAASPQAVREAQDAGLLTDLGYAPPRRPNPGWQPRARSGT